MLWNVFGKKFGNAKGSSHLALVVMISTGVAVMSMTTLALIETSGQTSNDFIKKKRSLFAAEGGIRVVQKLAQDYLSETVAPTSEGMAEYVNQHTQNLDLSGFSLRDIQTNIINSGETVIPSGPFSGMHAEVNTVEFKLNATTDDQKVSSTVMQKSVLGRIMLFQFFFFSDTYTEWNNGPEQTVKGRVHVNNDICFGGSSGYLSLETLTTSGRAMLISNRNCRLPQGTARAQISDGKNYQKVASGGDHGCTNCDGSKQAWKEYALNRWRGHLLDKAHDVPSLRLPGMGTETPAQRGRDNLANVVSNNGTMRILVDPVLPSDPPDKRTAKFAHQADIRIVNGVWYLKDPNNPMAWPGVPIWSDHPGHFTTTNEEGIEGNQAVGQDALRMARGWGAYTPRYYSYYEYDSTNSRLTGDEYGVISYGNLLRDASGGGTPIWKPGHWTKSGMDVFCGGAVCTGNSCGNNIQSAFQIMRCNNGTELHPSVGLLNATRGGFMNGHIQHAPGGNAQLAHQLPMNFDVEQFQQAIMNTTPGELGSYFGMDGFMGRAFNGIIYITNTWEGSLRGIDGSNTPVDWPRQGGVNDPLQPSNNINNRVQRALPFPLCSTTLAGQDYDGPAGGFVIPNCASYQPGAPSPILARPNVLRIHNGANISPNLFPKGLTIATNLPAYVLGSFNTSSNVDPRSNDWLPTLIAADFVSHLSNAWDDNNSRWNSSYIRRNATSTTYNHSVLAGYTVRSQVGGSGNDSSAAGINTFLRYNEDWTGQTHRINGSLVLGFTSVYFRWANECCSDATYQAPTRDWKYDEHLHSFSKQPPGTPYFLVYAIEDWYTGKKQTDR